jgi:hypothetical protein
MTGLTYIAGIVSLSSFRGSDTCAAMSTASIENFDCCSIVYNYYINMQASDMNYYTCINIHMKVNNCMLYLIQLCKDTPFLNL